MAAEVRGCGGVLRGGCSDTVYLDVHFTHTNRDYAASGAGGPPSDQPPDALPLVTLRHDPDNVATLFRSPGALPAEISLVEVVVWALPRAAALAPRIHRDTIRDALCSELAAIAGAERALFQERWVLQLRARPDPERLECLRTVWTGIRREETYRHTLPLRTDTGITGLT